MKKLIGVMCSVVALASVAGCTNNPSSAPETTTASGASSTSSSTTSTTSSSNPVSSSPESETVPAPEQEPQAQEPTVVHCLEGTPGPALWSDGSTAFSQWCFDTMGGPAYLEQEAQSGLDSVPIADGGTCPAYLCGYGHDENGNPNPSSGELQLMYGCEQGYVDDPSLCTAVQDKAAQYGW